LGIPPNVAFKSVNDVAGHSI